MPFTTRLTRHFRATAALSSLFLASIGLISCHSARASSVPDINAPPLVVPTSARTSLALTLYSLGGDSGYAFVREERKLHLAAGRFVLKADGIASGIVPETTRFELVSLDSDGKVDRASELYEQRYLYDRLGPARLLEKAEGQRVSVSYPAGTRSGKENQISGILLSSKQGVLIRTDAGEVVSLPDNARLSLSALPPDLVAEPTLSWNAGAYEESDALLRLSYRANNFSWRSDYVVVLDKGEKTADVEGWITVANLGDTSFESAKIQLVAGTVHTVQRVVPRRRFSLKSSYARYKTAEDAPRASEESLGELHLYTINEPSDLPSRSSKQVRFVVARQVPTALEAEAKVGLQSGDFQSMLTLKLDHKDGSALSVALPSGSARTSAFGSQGQPVMVGEGSTTHSPVGEIWRVPVAVDTNQITRLRVKEDKVLGRDHAGQALHQMSLEIELRNTGDKSRRRRVVIDSGHRILLSAQGSPVAKLDGPKQLLVEADLAIGTTRLLQLRVEYVDPNDVEYPGGLFLSPERDGDD